MKNTRNNISIIVAIAQNYAIGKDNQLLWHISEDLKRFKRITTGHRVIMGKKTYESLPIRPLPNRTNIIISDIPGDSYEGAVVVDSIDAALNHCTDGQESFIIGGGSVYRQFLEHANKLYLTLVKKDFEGDVFFPEIDFQEWVLKEEEDHGPEGENMFSYSFRIYERK